VALGNRDGWVYRYRLDSPSPSTPFATDTGTFRAMQWSRDGRTLHALTFEGGRFHWPMDATAAPRRYTASPLDVFLLNTAPADDGRHAIAVSTDGDVTVWDLADSTPPFRVPLVPTEIVCRDPADPKYDAAVEEDCAPLYPECAALSGDAKWVATCLPDNSVALYARDGSRKTRIFKTSGRTVSSVALSHDGTLLAAGLDSVVHLWRTDTPDAPGRDISAGDLAVQRLVFSPDASRIAARNVDGWVRVADVTSGATLVTVRPRGESLEELTFTPDSRYLLTLGTGEREARLWNVSGAGGSLPINAGGRMIEALAISPDGRWLVASNDRQGAQLQALDADLAIAPFRTMSICLSASRRARYLLESAAVAKDRYAQCERRLRAEDAAVARARPRS
jgi:WD40 repeat protein